MSRSYKKETRIKEKADFKYNKELRRLNKVRIQNNEEPLELDEIKLVFDSGFYDHKRYKADNSKPYKQKLK